LAGLSDLLWSDFFSGGTNTTEQLMSMIKSATLTTERWHGADFKVINAKLKLDDAPNSKGNYTVKLYIDKNHLLDRAIMNAGKFTYEISMSNVRLDPPLRPSQFAFHKPAYAKIEQSHIDPKAVALLSKADSTAGRMNAITATVHTDAGIASDSKGGLTRSSTETTCKLMRPNNVVIQTLATKNGDKPPYDEPLTTTISDGTTLWTINNEDKTYTRTDLSERPWQLTGVMFSGPLADFFMPRWSTAVDESRTAPMSVTYAGTQQWKNASYRVVEIDQTLSEGQESMRTRQTLYVGADNLVHRLIRRDYFSGKLATETDSYIVALDTAPKLAKADFAFTPSAEMKEAKADDAGEAPSKPLLANGTVAPDFTVHDRAGNPIRLSDYKGHVVVLDFWATWCGPCQESLPSTNAVARKYLKKDVVVLGVNVWDKPDAFNAWLPEHKNYDAIKFAIDPTSDQKDVASSLYNVSGIPTQYVIDGLGRIVWSTDGFSGSDDDLVAAVEKALKQE
jgi:thiol-disulfide isomerase/thioredoxin/outer membrane lipoprotein-sorting protein